MFDHGLVTDIVTVFKQNLKNFKKVFFCHYKRLDASIKYVAVYNKISLD